MKSNYKKLGHPIFILSIILLLLNDWIFKTAFHNELTGKLSDFAGLLAFPYFFSVLFPKYRKSIHWLTVVGFIFWKSIYVQPIIDAINFVGFPIYRVVDFTDNIALLSVLGSYFLLEHRWYFQLKPIFIRMIIGVSLFSFLATSLPPIFIVQEEFEINKIYDFPFDKEYLISRSNIVQVEAIDELIAKNDFYFHDYINFDQEKNVYYIEGFQRHSNSVYSTNDTLVTTDTLAIILDVNKVANQDTVLMETIFADWQIYKTSENTSAIKLLRLRTFFRMDKRKRNLDKKTLKYFEKYFIEKI